MDELHTLLNTTDRVTWDTVRVYIVPDRESARHDRSPGRRNTTAGSTVYYDPWKVTITSRAYPLALPDVLRSILNSHPVWCIFSKDWPGSYENDLIVNDESEEADDTAALATAMLEYADRSEPHVAVPDGWNVTTRAKTTPPTVRAVSQDAKVNGLWAQIYSRGVDAPASITTVSELLDFASAKYQPPTGGSS